MTPSRVIINADDFGMSPGTNQGIIEAVSQGVVRSTSLMANMPGFEEAVGLAGQAPRLGVGVHLNLTCGMPLTGRSEIPSLVQANGEFWPLGKLIARVMLGKIKTHEMDIEWKAQIDKVVASGITPTHLDSHQHVHFWPTLRPLLDAYASNYHIKWVRGAGASLLRDVYYPQSVRGDVGIYTGIAKLACLSPLRGKRHDDDVKHPEGLIGSTHVPVGHYQSALLEFLESASRRFSEILCHPGYVDEQLVAQNEWIRMREEELRALTSDQTVQQIERLGLEVVHYGEVRQ